MKTSTPPLYSICQLGQGNLFMMPKPSAENLKADLAYYRSQGVTCVVSVLLETEVKAHQLQEEGALCEQLGMRFKHFAIKDMDTPEQAALKDFNQTLKQALEQGEGIAIHCHGGRGRAGTVAITLMKEFGYTTEEASQIAQTGRQDPNVPVCDNQRAFVKQY